MTPSYTPFFRLLFFFSLLLSGCAINPIVPEETSINVITIKERKTKLLNKKVWQLNGKIAFIQKINENSKRESASINWQVNDKNKTQKLNLTSYLGINVLNLTSNNKQHSIKVDGKEYQGTNLASLIYSLTGLVLPTQALKFWLKGLPYKTDDILEINKETQLPIMLSSYHHNALWQINYSQYQKFNSLNMATQFTIKNGDLLIKIAVKNWSFNDKL